MASDQQKKEQEELAKAKQFKEESQKKIPPNKAVFVWNTFRGREMMSQPMEALGVTVWNEFVHERENAERATIYPRGIQQTPADS